MKAKRQTDVIVHLEHDEVHLLRNALRGVLHIAAESHPNLGIDNYDQHGKIRELINILTEEE